MAQPGGGGLIYNMSKYYKYIIDRSNLSTRSGANLNVPTGFQERSASLISKCITLQGLIQNIIYATHGAEIFGVKRTL